MIEAETLFVPPPAAMVVEAEPADPRTVPVVPVLTTPDALSDAGGAALSEPVALGSSFALDTPVAPDGARIISVLTAPQQATCSDERPFPHAGNSDQAQPFSTL